MNKYTGASAAILATLFLSACGGGDGPVASSPGIPDDELEQIQSDPRVVRLGSILERADALLIPSLHSRYTISVQGQSTSDRLTESFSCTASRCVGNESGSVISLTDLLAPDTAAVVTLTGVDLGSQETLDTGTLSGTIERSDVISGITITSDFSGDDYGVWGQHGAAFVEIIEGPFSGQTQGVPFTGDINIASAIAVGNITGTNPAGVGSATWTGIAEAASTRTFQRRQGTATLTIADLSQPRVGVDIDISDFAIGSSGWSDMPLINGHFATGTVGIDHLEGNFHGPDHSEAYGVFDTGAYVGAFGAKRTPVR